jgi:hypothetical protein
MFRYCTASFDLAKTSRFVETTAFARRPSRQGGLGLIVWQRLVTLLGGVVVILF